MVDHIDGGVLAGFTLRNFAIADATEVFVFLAGLVTVLAYQSVATRHGAKRADQRFLRRSLEIYRAFILTAILMFAVGGLLLWLSLTTPSLSASEVRDFTAAPLRTLIEVATLQRQPFLSDILPMYLFFAMLAPLAIRLARYSWSMLLAVSATLWLFAPWLGQHLPAASMPNWSFNPFAWQLLFVLGVLAGSRPELIDYPTGAWRRGITVAAVVVALISGVFAFFTYYPSIRELFLATWPERGIGTFSKSNASFVRVVNFLAIAWLFSEMVRRGWLDRWLTIMQPIAMVGRHGLVCFVGGAVISVLAEALSFSLSRGTPTWPYNMLADCYAVAALFSLAYVADVWRSYRRRAARAVQAPGLSVAAPPYDVIRLGYSKR